MSAVKKQRTVVRDASASFAALPSPATQRILEYSAAATSKDAVGQQLSFRRTLWEWSSVSHEWRACVDEIASANELETLQINAAITTRQELLDARNKLTLRRAVTRTLLFQATDAREVTAPGIVQSLASHTPRLESLCITTTVETPRRLMTAMLRSSARLCPQVTSVVITCHSKSNATPASAVEADAFVVALFDAVAAWSKFNGLRELVVPVEMLSEDQDGDAYFQHLADFCPRIKLINDKQLHSGGVAYECHWVVGLEAWSSFCRSCTQLTRFDWGGVPFATAYFDAFGAVTKPHLRQLRIYADKFWSWPNFFERVDADTTSQVQRTGFADTARHVESVLRACPSLEELEITWDVVNFDFINAITTGVFDGQVYGDEFFRTLGAACPRLDALRCFRKDWRHAVDATVAFSDDAMSQLARLRYLSKVFIAGAAVGGRGLAEAVLASTPFARRPREFDLRFGMKRDHNTTRGAPFYDTLCSFLQYLASYNGNVEAPASPWVSLTMVNEWLDEVDKNWSDEYFNDIQRFAAQTAAKHPASKLRVLMNGHNGARFKRIRELLVQIGGTDEAAREWSLFKDLGDEFEDAALDGVFTNRTFVRYFADGMYGPEDTHSVIRRFELRLYGKNRSTTTFV